MRASAPASSDSADFRLVLHAHLADGYELSKVLLAKAGFDGALHLLTSGWERVLGYGRKELGAKTLAQLMWGNRRSAAAAVSAVLDRANMRPVTLRVCCRNGLGKGFRLHRLYDREEHMMYVVAEEIVQNRTGVIARRGERRAAGRRT